MALPNFFSELKRRNVYKVAVAYAVVAWLLIQAASILFPTFEAPSWVMKVFVAVVLLGFPLALIFAWAFELTPEGLKRTEEVEPQQSIARRTGRKLIAITAAVAALALALLVFQVARSRSSARVSPPSTAITSGSSSVPIAEKSIAVLPFENLSRDPDNAFFASGIQDEILTALAKISGLNVISRKSTLPYGSSPQNLPDIARQLGVAHILEGSVQKVADKVHINLQLIRAETDAHVWAQTYDRTLADIFGVEAEVARSVAQELQAKLTPEEKVRVETKPTENSDAYVLYLRAKEYASRPGDLLEEEQMAVDLFTNAIKLDPTFALARAHLSQVLSHIYLDFQPTEAIASRARVEAEESLRLQRDLGEGHWALALYFYWTQKDYENALRELEIAGQLLPNEGEIQAIVAYIRRRQGRWREALEILNQVVVRDPRNASTAHEYFRTLGFLRDWPNAIPAAERAVALAPDSPVVIVDTRYVSFWSKGDLEPLQAALAAMPPTVDPDGFVTLTRCDVALLARDFAAAEAAVASRGEGVILSALQVPSPKKYLLGCIALARGDTAHARILFEEVRPHFESQAEANPLDSFRHAQLGLIYAYLGRKEDAIREGQRAIELTPEKRDALAGVIFSCVMAKIYAQIGEANQAIPLIERLLITPGGVSYISEGSLTLQELRRRWQWDPLRNDPRFQKILAGPEPKTVYH